MHPLLGTFYSIVLTFCSKWRGLSCNLLKFFWVLMNFFFKIFNRDNHGRASSPWAQSLLPAALTGSHLQHPKHGAMLSWVPAGGMCDLIWEFPVPTYAPQRVPQPVPRSCGHLFPEGSLRNGGQAYACGWWCVWEGPWHGTEGHRGGREEHNVSKETSQEVFCLNSLLIYAWEIKIPLPRAMSQTKGSSEPTVCHGRWVRRS